ncbi:hypothetical protein AAC387_Pa02g3513 [Persea americana]
MASVKAGIKREKALKLDSIAMANFNTTHSVIFSCVLLCLFALHTCNNSTSKGDESLEQKAIQGRDEKYLTPCIESLLCNDLKAAPDVHLGHCWCCIFKGQCYSSEFICTVLCILPPNSATNETSHVP